MALCSNGSKRRSNLVNRSREAEGLSRLQLGADINQTAQARAQDMFQRHYYAHTSPEGDDVQDRYIDAGGSRWRLAAENIARCAACHPPITAELIERFHEGWMNSPHHRENILREFLDRFGYGIKLDADQCLYAVQTFAGPGTPRPISGADEPETLSPDEVSALAAKLINRAREKTGRDTVNLDAGLRQAAEPRPRSTITDPRPRQERRDLMNALPAGERGQWRRLAAVSGLRRVRDGADRPRREVFRARMAGRAISRPSSRQRHHRHRLCAAGESKRAQGRRAGAWHRAIGMAARPRATPVALAIVSRYAVSCSGPLLSLYLGVSSQ